MIRILFVFLYLMALSSPPVLAQPTEQNTFKRWDRAMQICMDHIAIYDEHWGKSPTTITWQPGFEICSEVKSRYDIIQATEKKRIEEEDRNATNSWITLQRTELNELTKELFK